MGIAKSGNLVNRQEHIAQAVVFFRLPAALTGWAFGASRVQRREGDDSGEILLG